MRRRRGGPAVSDAPRSRGSSPRRSLPGGAAVWLAMVVLLALGVAWRFAPRPGAGPAPVAVPTAESAGRRLSSTTSVPELGNGLRPDAGGRRDATASTGDSPADLPPVPVRKPETGREIVDEAGPVLRHLVSKLPDLADSHELWARFHDWQGNASEAERAWQRCLEIDPNYAYALNGLASVAAKRGDHDVASALYRRSVTAHPGSLSARLELGRSLIASGHSREATEVLEQTVARFVASDEAHYELGVAYRDLAEWVSAKRAFEKALALREGHSRALIALAAVCQQLGLEDEAAGHRAAYREVSAAERVTHRGHRLDFDERVATGTDVAQLYVDAGRIYLTQGESASAKLLWDRAVVLDPQNTDARRLYIAASLHRGEISDAIRGLKELVELRPDVPGYRIELGDLLGRVGRFDDAEECLSEVCRRWPEEPAGLVALAKHYLRTGRHFERALGLARQVTRMAPEAEHFVLLSGCHERLGQWNQAVNAMDRALEYEPSHVIYLELRRELQRRAAMVDDPR